VTAVIERWEIDQALLDMVTTAAGTNFTVGLNDLPAGAKYALILPMPTGRVGFGPPLVAPDSLVGIEYDIISVGADNRQAGWVADQVRAILCDRDPAGVLVTGLTVDEHYVIEREQVGPLGAVQLIEGVYQAHDSYMLTVGRF
jgi:hypothetical protein